MIVMSDRLEMPVFRCAETGMTFLAGGMRHRGTVIIEPQRHKEHKGEGRGKPRARRRWPGFLNKT